MLLQIFYLFTTSVFAANYDNQFRSPLTAINAASSLPIDYNDDFNDKRLMINNANLIYKFEQIRRDQPPQIEQREENIGKYMYRRPQVTTTSTTTSPTDPALQEINSLPPLPDFNPPVRKDDSHNQWNYMSAYPSTIPPPPSTPKWEDLSVILNKQSTLHNQHQQTYEFPQISESDLYMQVHHFPHYQRQISFPPSSDSTWTQTSTQVINIKQTLPNQFPAQIFQNQDVPSTNIRPAYSQMTHVVKYKPDQNPAIPQATRLAANRGSHKFTWNDIVTPEVTTATTRSSTVDHQSHYNPPPVPTLSPWLDGYKK